MPKVPRNTRSKILNAAYGLFYRKGFGRVGVDEISADAGITKRTLYQHFKSKDDLLAAVLDVHHQLALVQIKKHEDRYSGSANDLVDVMFEGLSRWSMKPGWTGTGFTRLAMELADLPGHPARVAARRHKQALEVWWTALLVKARVKSAPEKAREILMLMEGATALILIQGDRSYAATAANAAKRLLLDPKQLTTRHPAIKVTRSRNRPVKKT